VARLWMEKHPTVVRVQNVERAQEIAALCMAHGIHYIIGLEPNEPEDVIDLGRALSPAEPSKARRRAGRNASCPCGSGQKSKKCCAGEATSP
jgi:SWIM/SEC-C metal-binding protein